MIQGISFKGMPQNLWSTSIEGATAKDMAVVANDAVRMAIGANITHAKMIKENEPQFFDGNGRFTKAGVEALKAQADAYKMPVKNLTDLRNLWAKRLVEEYKDAKSIDDVRECTETVIRF